MNDIASFWNQFWSGVPDVIIAALVLVLAFIVATIAKNLTIKMLKFIGLESAMDKAGVDEKSRIKTRDFISQLIYLIVFVLFLPGIFEKLGLNNIAQPIISMMDGFTTYLPNIVAAIILLIIGLFVAKIVKGLIQPVFNKVGVDTWLKRVGYTNGEDVQISEVLATIVYVLILIPVAISALTVLGIEAISRPAINMLDQIVIFLPRIAIAVAIIFIGRFIAKLVFMLVEQILKSIGLDKATHNIFNTSGTKVKDEFSLSKLIANVVRVIIMIFFSVEALNTIQLEVLTKIGNSVIEYLPLAVSAIVFMGIAVIAANWVEKSILAKFSASKATALIAKVAIISVGVFVMLYQLGIAREMVNAAFIILFGAFGVAFAISFGIGGKTFAEHTMKKLETKIDGATKKK